MSLFNFSKDILDDNITKNNLGDKICIIETVGRETTYNELLTLVKQMCSYLMSKDVRYEERIAIALSDRREFIILFLAITRIGAVAVPLNPDNTILMEELVYDMKARLLFTDRPLTFTNTANSTNANTIATEIINILNENVINTISSLPLSEYIAPTIEDSSCFWLSTSGTSGKPKFITHRHLSPILIIDIFNVYKTSDRVYCVSPLFFTYGKSLVYKSYYLYIMITHYVTYKPIITHHTIYLYYYYTILYNT